MTAGGSYITALDTAINNLNHISQVSASQPDFSIPSELLEPLAMPSKVLPALVRYSIIFSSSIIR